MRATVSEAYQPRLGRGRLLPALVPMRLRVEPRNGSLEVVMGGRGIVAGGRCIIQTQDRSLVRSPSAGPAIPANAPDTAMQPGLRGFFHRLSV